jgi:hypothetical protein
MICGDMMCTDNTSASPVMTELGGMFCVPSA